MHIVWEEIGDVLHGLGEDRGWTSKPDFVWEGDRGWTPRIQQIRVSIELLIQQIRVSFVKYRSVLYVIDTANKCIY